MKIAVVGAGMAGLSAAFRLQEDGFDVTVFERNEFPGGRTKTIRTDGFTIDVGAGLLPSTYVDVIRLLEDSGNTDLCEKIDGYAAIHRDEQLFNLSLRKPIQSLLTTKLFPLSAKLSLFRIFIDLAAHGDKLRFDTTADAAAIDTQSLAEYAEKKLNDEIHDYFLEPFIRTMYLHNADESSIVETLWCLKNLASNSSFFLKGGMDRLAARLSENLKVRYNCSVESIVRDSGRCILTYRSQDGDNHSETFNACVAALNAPGLFHVLSNVLTQEQQAFIANQKYSVSVNIHYRLKAPPRATALLIQAPKATDPYLAAIVQDHLKGADRAPAGKGLISAFFLTDWGARMIDRPDAEILSDATARVEKVLPGFRDLVEGAHIERWRYAATLGEVGRYKALQAFEASLDPSDCIQLASDIFAPSSVNVAVKQGERAANRLIQRFAAGAKN